MPQKKEIFIGAAVLLLGLIIWAIATVPEPPSASDATPEARIMSYADNTLSEERDGRTVWTLTAQQVNVDIDTQDTSMRGVVGTFYAEDGRTLALQADEGRMESGTRDIVLTGSVQAQISDGSSLRAKELKWTAVDASLTARGDAEITRDDLRATGDEIRSTDEFQQFSINGNARIEKGGAK